MVEAPIPDLSDGQVLIRHRFLGLAPAVRLRMSENLTYAQPMALGEVVYSQAVGHVVQSRDASLKPGDYVFSLGGGWQDYSVAPASALQKIDEAIAPASVWLGALGTSGMTAYVGLLDIGQPKSGETVVVSAASGGVGSVAGQIARIKGCRVVGIAGGEAKVRHLVDDLRFDAGVDHRSPDFAAQLQAACPDGVSVYFDNVGGAPRDAVWPLMNPDGRIVVCGVIAEYNDARQGGPGWFDILVKRLTIRGFSTAFHMHRRNDFLRDVGGWYRTGEIRVHEDVSEGMESVVPAFIRMMTGRNFGKTVIRL